MRLKCLFTVALIALSVPAMAQLKPQNKVELQDVNIRGEILKSGMGLSSRARNTLDGRIILRDNFRDRTLEELPPYFNSKTLPAAKGKKASQPQTGDKAE